MPSTNNRARCFERIVPDAGVAADLKQRYMGGWGQYQGVGWIVQLNYSGRVGGPMRMEIGISEAPQTGQHRVDLEELLREASETECTPR